MPAAAVIPGPIVYVEVVAVKGFAVEIARPSGRRQGAAFCVSHLTGYFEKIKVLQTGDRLNITV